MRDLINLYISLEGADGEECPHIEYDISVSKDTRLTFTLISEALTQILAQGERTARFLKQMDHIQETELLRSKLYVIYLHRTASDTTIPIASGATLSAGTPAAATPDWEMWDNNLKQEGSHYGSRWATAKRPGLVKHQGGDPWNQHFLSETEDFWVICYILEKGSVINTIRQQASMLPWHSDASWGQVVTYPPGVGVVEWTSLRYEMLYATAFPHHHPDPNFKIKVALDSFTMFFFCKVWSTKLLFEVLEFMGQLKTDDLLEFLTALEDFSWTDYSDFQEIHLSHNWFHTEVLSTINESASGLLEGELLNEAEILLGESGDSKATSSA
ncbi:hypothetical protein ARMGADRAFT_1030163 [Armillaria gallica]|uniref:Uncharacterized protein n=1 Tax=Armillaria gallica TaxID=47427 RepID=A0A2H3DEA0_ARMGA|nr:hypothetical protein ARMGADRAFT_1030163 [Armillaria gallica]